MADVRVMAMRLHYTLDKEQLFSEKEQTPLLDIILGLLKRLLDIIQGLLKRLPFLADKDEEEEGFLQIKKKKNFQMGSRQEFGRRFLKKRGMKKAKKEKLTNKTQSFIS